MKAVRLIANILFYLTRTAAVLYLATTLYTLLVIALAEAGVSWAPIEISGDGGFSIFYPFTKTPFLLGDYNGKYLAMMIVLIGFYGLFLWLLSEVFNAFRQQKLFTPKNVRRLVRFYITNLTVPLPALIITAFFYNEGLRDVTVITFLHLVIGIFAFFMAAIFKQGLVLQEEQDLTL
jgi:Protein of unknown function (DUF2975)